MRTGLDTPSIRRIRRLDLAAMGVWLLLAATALSAALAVPAFRDPSNLANILRQSSVLGILAIGQTFVVMAGMIDLSVGMIAGLPFLLLFGAMLNPEALGNYGAVLARFTNYYEFNGGFYYGVKWVLDHYHLKPSNTIVGAIATCVQCISIAAIVLWPVRDRSVRTLAGRALLLTSVLIITGAKVHVWYFVAPLFLLPLAAGMRLRRAWLWAALIAPVTYAMYAADPPHERMELVAVEWGGFLLLALYGMVRDRIITKPPIPDGDGRGGISSI